MSSTPMLFRILNPIMKTLLKSPIHSVVSDKIMIISFMGKKTGKRYSTPVSYVRANGTVYCFTHAGWWRNLTGADVSLRIRGSDYQGRAEAVTEDSVHKADVLTKLLRGNPVDARFYDVSLDEDGEPNAAEIDRAVTDAVMIETALRAA